MERDYGFPAAIAGADFPHAMTSMGVDEAFLRGYFTDLISLQPALSPLLNYYFPYDAGVSAPQIQYAPPMNYHSPYDDGVSAAQFQSAPLMNYDYPCHDGVFASQFQYEPPLNYPSLFQFPAFSPYRYLEQEPERPQKLPKIESFDSQEFAFQLLNLNAAGVTPEPLINLFSTPDGVTAAKYQHQMVLEEVKSVKKTYTKRPEAGRARRRRISENTQRLQRLLPWDKKMDTGTMLEETYKYVKFLEAQVSILQAMPVESKTPWNPSSQLYSSLSRDHSKSKVEIEEELSKLDRQQLLQVMVNSPAAQTLLYSRGFCVYSGEQLDHVLLNLADKKAVWEQMMFASPFRFHY